MCIQVKKIEPDETGKSYLDIPASTAKEINSKEQTRMTFVSDIGRKFCRLVGFPMYRDHA